MVINRQKLYQKFIDIENVANINLLACYSVLFTKRGIIKNYGCYTIIPILILHIIFIIFFYQNQIQKIHNIIENISYGIKHWIYFVTGKKFKKNYLYKNADKNKKNRIKKRINNILDKSEFKNIIYSTNKKNNDSSNTNKEFKKININNFNMITSNILHFHINNNKKKNKNKKILKKTKKIMKLNDAELNDLSFLSARKKDKRTYCQYYLSLLKSKQIFFFIFNSKDYNSRIIKADLFLFSFTLSYFVNALFFNDETMHKIYEDCGSFDLIYQLPQIAYSSLISSILEMILGLLALSENNILLFKNDKNIINLRERANKINQVLKAKFILYFILSTILLFFFWYFISMFCSIYKNTQIHLIKDTLISFGLSLNYPFGICLLPGIFRIPSLSNKKNSTKKYLFNISKLLQMI